MGNRPVPLTQTKRVGGNVDVLLCELMLSLLKQFFLSTSRKLLVLRKNCFNMTVYQLEFSPSPKIMSGLLYGWSKSSRVIEMNQDEMVSIEKTNHWKTERKKWVDQCAPAVDAGVALAVFCVVFIKCSQAVPVPACGSKPFFPLVIRYFPPKWLFQLPLEKATSIKV